jgi:membrane protein YqaA with SNARE-associated domain
LQSYQVLVCLELKRAAPADMENHLWVLFIIIQTTKKVSHWIFHLGAFGLIPLGVLDASVVPLPGSMDVLTIVLAAKQPDWWIYYALMATAGSVLGNYLTYRLARKGGKETLERRLSRKSMDKVTQTFERWGFGAIAIPALLPPPMPMIPFVLAAGAAKYSLKKFLFALTLGRIVRYSVLALLAAHYGHQIISFMRNHGHPVFLIVLGVVAIAIVVFLVLRYGKKGKSRGSMQRNAASRKA